MESSRKSIVFTIVLVAILSLSLISAGCIGSVSVFPTEVKNHGHTIYVDPNYVSSVTIAEMLLNPESYERELYDTIDTYLPKKNPVVEVGVGTGAVMAYVSNKLNMPKQHIAVEPNPYLLPNLQKTIEKNALVVNLYQSAIAYNSENPYVPITISKDLSQNVVAPKETLETINVPATTINELITQSTFSKNTNVTLIVETSNLLKSIFQNEANLKDHVYLIIGYVPELHDNEEAAFLNIAYNAGYELLYSSITSDSGVVAYVFKRMEHQDNLKRTL